jgi:peptidoglycan/xylan/chitin deacetylase (PgdA/CDA1 family)
MFAESTKDPNTASLPTRMGGMASRFFARQSRNKLMKLRNAAPMVTFTFDDVPASACELGARILEQHGIRGTFYVAGGGCGTVSADGPPRASIDQLRRIWANGHEIGCHTFSHPAVRSMPLDELGVELDRNQAVLKTINNNIVLRNFAYPYGDLSIRTKRYLESRFDSCRSSHAGINSRVADLGALAAWPLQNASLDRGKIVKLVAATVQSRGWLIFYSHDVAERPSRFGISPELLEWAAATAKRAGCVLANIAEGLSVVAGAGTERRGAASS